MSVSLEIKVIRDTAGPALANLRSALTPQRMAAAVGPACAKLTQQHLLDLGTNKKGWPTTNFYARAAKATNWAAAPEGVVVSINQIGVRQRYQGGPIRPVNAKYLTIPIDPEAYGKVASDFENLICIRTKKGKYLAQKEGTGKTATLKFLFKLSPGVDQEGDVEVLPTRDEYFDTAKEAILRAIKPDKA